MEKVLSISIAAYNVENFIEQNLNSLSVKEVLEDLEVLVISDGSTDKTNELVEKYQKEFPDTFKLISKENGGWGSTVNRGMQEASGKFFKLLDGDDWVFSENLSEFISYLKNSSDDLVLSAFGMFDEKSGKVYDIKKMKMDNRKSLLLDECDSIKDIQMHAMAVNMDVIRKADIKIVDHCFYTDTQFVAEVIANVKTISYFSKTVYCYRVGLEGQSISPEGMKKHMGDNIKVAKELLEYAKCREIAGIAKELYDVKLNYALTMELYAYSCLDKTTRVDKYQKLMAFIDENQIDFVSASTEVRLDIMTNYQFARAIHRIFEWMRLISKKLGLDLIIRQ